MTHKLTLTVATVLLATLVAAPGPAQDDLLVKPCGGAIGKTIQLEILNGNASEKCFLITSFKRTSIPLHVLMARTRARSGWAWTSRFCSCSWASTCRAS